MSGCAPIGTSPEEFDTRQVLAARQCEGPSPDGCVFVNSPVKLEQQKVNIPSRIASFYPTAERLEFIDLNRRRWIAPQRTLTDGASIPWIFVPIVGSPTSQEFVNAAAVHDAYCGIGNEFLDEYHSAPWQDVHRMFYDALRVGGTPEHRAKVMFAAVYLGGPRWNNPGRNLDFVPDAYLRQALLDTMAFIDAKNPTLPELIDFIEGLEKKLIETWTPPNEDDDTGPRRTVDKDVPDPETPDTGGEGGGSQQGGEGYDGFSEGSYGKDQFPYEPVVVVTDS